MKFSIWLILLGINVAVLPALAAPSVNAPRRPAVADTAKTDSQQMSRDLQNLPWKSFRSVVEAVPKLSAAVNAYGPAGWNFVKANYTRYNWTKQINKLDAEQKKQLAELIRKAKTNPEGKL